MRSSFDHLHLRSLREFVQSLSQQVLIHIRVIRAIDHKRRYRDPFQVNEPCPLIDKGIPAPSSRAGVTIIVPAARTKQFNNDRIRRAPKGWKFREMTAGSILERFISGMFFGCNGWIVFCFSSVDGGSSLWHRCSSWKGSPKTGGRRWTVPLCFNIKQFKGNRLPPPG